MPEKKQFGKRLTSVLGGKPFHFFTRGEQFSQETSQRNEELARGIQEQFEKGLISRQKATIMLSNLPDYKSQSVIDEIADPTLAKNIGSIAGDASKAVGEYAKEKVKSGAQSIVSRNIDKQSGDSLGTVKQLIEDASAAVSGFIRGVGFVSEGVRDTARTAVSATSTFENDKPIKWNPYSGSFEPGKLELGEGEPYDPERHGTTAFLGEEKILDAFGRSRLISDVTQGMGATKTQSEFLGPVLAGVGYVLDLYPGSGSAKGALTREVEERIVSQALENEAKRLGLSSVDDLSIGAIEKISKKTIADYAAKQTAKRTPRTSQKTMSLPKKDDGYVFLRSGSKEQKAQRAEFIDVPHVVVSIAPDPNTANRVIDREISDYQLSRTMRHVFSAFDPEYRSLRLIFEQPLADREKLSEFFKVIAEHDYGELTSEQQDILRFARNASSGILNPEGGTGAISFSGANDISRSELEGILAQLPDEKIDTIANALEREVPKDYSTEVNYESVKWSDIYSIERYDADGKPVRQIDGGRRRGKNDPVYRLAIPVSQMDAALGRLQRGNPMFPLEGNQSQLSTLKLEEWRKRKKENVSTSDIENHLENLRSTNQNPREQVAFQHALDSIILDGYDEVPFEIFENRVQSGILPLKTVFGRARLVKLPDGKVEKVSTSLDYNDFGINMSRRVNSPRYGDEPVTGMMLLESPILTSGASDIHFGGEFPQYFGHVRYIDYVDPETGKLVREIQEIQNDFYQSNQGETPEYRNLVERETGKIRQTQLDVEEMVVDMQALISLKESAGKFTVTDNGLIEIDGKKIEDFLSETVPRDSSTMPLRSGDNLDLGNHGELIRDVMGIDTGSQGLAGIKKVFGEKAANKVIESKIESLIYMRALRLDSAKTALKQESFEAAGFTEEVGKYLDIYRQKFAERMTEEAIRQSAQDGVEIFRFPKGGAAKRIQGHIEHNPSRFDFDAMGIDTDDLSSANGAEITDFRGEKYEFIADEENGIYFGLRKDSRGRPLRDKALEKKYLEELGKEATSVSPSDVDKDFRNLVKEFSEDSDAVNEVASFQGMSVDVVSRNLNQLAQADGALSSGEYAMARRIGRMIDRGEFTPSGNYTLSDKQFVELFRVFYLTEDTGKGNRRFRESILSNAVQNASSRLTPSERARAIVMHSGDGGVRVRAGKSQSDIISISASDIRNNRYNEALQQYAEKKDTIFRRYEKDIPKFLKNRNYNPSVYFDDHNFEWQDVNLTPQMGEDKILSRGEEEKTYA